MVRRIPADRRSFRAGPRDERGGPSREGRPDRGAKKTRTDPRVRARADELHESGMPFQMAMAVALGRVRLNEALERLARQEKVTKLMEEHELSRALAMQIVIGHASLDAVLARRRLLAHRDENKMRSCLQSALESGTRLAIALHGQRKVIGVVLELLPYSVTVQTDDGPEEIHKLQLKYGYNPDEWKKVRKGVRSDKVVAKSPREPIERPQDRYTCSDKRLFRYMDRETPVVVTLLEGEQIKGLVEWFGRYEFGLKLRSSEVPITVFRHCLHDITEA
ncbi:MAG: sRNA-binding regulator protein Hfq [Kiritimatiellia bacterium]|jgi:sRNA-binding regulator protein Hfq